MDNPSTTTTPPSGQGGSKPVNDSGGGHHNQTPSALPNPTTPTPRKTITLHVRAPDTNLVNSKFRDAAATATASAPVSASASPAVAASLTPTPAAPAAPSTTTTDPPRRKRGRPRKNSVTVPQTQQRRRRRTTTTTTATTTPRSRKKAPSRRRSSAATAARRAMIAEAEAAALAAEKTEEEAESEPEEEEDNTKKPWVPTLADFKGVSTHSFPYLIRRPDQDDTVTAAPPNSPATGSEISTPTSVSTAARDGDRTQKPLPPWETIHPSLKPAPVVVDRDTGEEETLVRLRSGRMPMTAEFWWDWTVAERAKAATDLDVKMMCLQLLRTRAQNEVPHHVLVSNDKEKNNEPGFRVWERAVQAAVAKGKAWMKIRRWKYGERKKAGGWAVWESKKRRSSRGEFVVDGPRGAWVLRAPEVDGEILRILRLGYKRQGRLLEDGTFDDSIADHWVSVEEFRKIREELAKKGNEVAVVDDENDGGAGGAGGGDDEDDGDDNVAVSDEDENETSPDQIVDADG